MTAADPHAHGDAGEESLPGALPEPRTPQEAMEQARARIAASADARGEGWDALARLVEPPTIEVVTALRDGTLAGVLREATTWLGEDTAMVAAPLMSLDVYVRSAERRTPEADLASLVEDRAEIDVGAGGLPSGAVAALALPMRELAVLCHHEARAWASGDMDLGKQLRAQQRVLADERLVPDLPPVAKVLVDEGLANLTRTVGRLLLAFLSAETGKDYQRAVLGDPRSRSRM